MIVEIDGKRVEVLNDVKIIYEDRSVLRHPDADDEVSGDIHITLGHEGMTLDFVQDDEVVASQWKMVSDISESIEIGNRGKG